MNIRFQITLVLLLIVQIMVLIKVVSVPESDEAILPILTPVSLDYERSYRDVPAVDIHKMIQEIHQIQPTSNSIGLESVEQFVSDRKKMLELRNQRHNLNIKLMNSGIQLITLLDEKQWNWVQSQRDRVQSNQEADSMENLLIRWNQRD